MKYIGTVLRKNNNSFVNKNIVLESRDIKRERKHRYQHSLLKYLKKKIGY